MASNEGVYVFPDAATRSVANGIDPGLLALLNQNGGFGGNGNWIWILFLWMMWGGNGNGWNGMNGNGFVSNQLNNMEGRDLLLQAINGRADALGQLAQITNSSVETVKNNLFTIQSAIQTVGSQIGMSSLELQNAILSGNAALSQQLCNCCCENRIAILNQTNALQSQLANHDASVRLQLAQNEAADQLSVCQQTNTLTRQADGNTNSILSAIQNQNAMIVDQFCQIKERELQSKIDTQSDIITQLRGQLDNDRQTAQLFNAINPLQAKVNEIANKQPNTVPVQWPNLTAVNNTPNVGGYGYGYPYGWGNGFGGSIVF